MSNFFSYGNLPIILTSSILAVILIIVLIIKRNYDEQNKISDDVVRQLEAMSELFGTTSDKVKKAKPVKSSKLDKIIDKWGNQLKDAGLVEPKYTNKQIFGVTLVICLVFYLIFTLLTQNLGIGLIPIGSFFLFFIPYLEQKQEKREQIFEDQIPAFLSILKSNVQSGETPDNAFKNAIDDMDDPLYSELKEARSLMDVQSLNYALERLRVTTRSDVLKFLCGCVELAAREGANLESQIEIIEDMLNANRELKRKLKVAASKHIPLFYVSAIILPGLFMFMYFTMPQVRDFWFVKPISWIVAAVVVGVYAIGNIAVKKIIDNTGKF